MRKSNLFCLAAAMIFISSLFCEGIFDCEPREAMARVERVSQKAQKSVIIKLKRIEREVFGGREDGVREN